MDEECIINLFSAECIRLDQFIRMYCATGFSDREICAVLGQILKEVISRQEDPKGALAQIICVLQDPKSVDCSSAHTPSDP
jgi:hypothetical protein